MTPYEKAKRAEEAMDAACKRVAGADWLSARYTNAYDHDDALRIAKAAFDAACEETFGGSRARFVEPDAQSVLISRDGVDFDTHDVIAEVMVAFRDPSMQGAA